MDVAYNYSRKRGSATNQRRYKCWASVCPFWSKEIDFRMLLGRPHVTACHLGKLSHCTQKTALPSLWFYFYITFRSSRFKRVSPCGFFFFFFPFASLTENPLRRIQFCQLCSFMPTLHSFQFRAPGINLWMWCFVCFIFKRLFIG